MPISLTDGESALVNAAVHFLQQRFTNPPMKFGESFRADLEWTPPVTIKANNHLNVFIQPSEEKVYPLIMQLRHADLLAMPDPIAVYAICPEEITHNAEQKRQIKKLEAHGYGLIVVPIDGEPEIKIEAIPLIQHISDEVFNNQCVGLPVLFRRELNEAFRIYKQNPVLGLKHECDFIEGLVVKSGIDAAKKGWIETKYKKTQTISSILDALTGTVQMSSSLASLGAMRAFIQMHRNTNAHFPKNKSQAIKKYRNCRHAFIDGIEKIGLFRDQMRKAGLTGGFANL